MPSIIHGLPREEYDLIDRRNWSRLKKLAKSPAHYLHSLSQKEERTDALVLGDATHVATFEPEAFRARFAIWEGGRRAGREWGEFCDANKLRDVLTEEQARQAQIIANTVRNHPKASKLVTGGKSEVTVLWRDEETGVDCKARLDFVANCGALVDLKTTRDASPEAFGRQCVQLGYCGQVAWYADGYAAVTGEHLPFKLVSVEKDAPHVVGVYNVPDFVLELGREHYRALLQLYVRCRDSSRWPGYGDGEEMELQLPRWALPALDDDMDADSLDFTQTEA